MGVSRKQREDRLRAQVAELRAQLASNSCRRCGSDPAREKRGTLIYLASEVGPDGAGPDRCPACHRVPVIALPHNDRDPLTWMEG